MITHLTKTLLFFPSHLLTKLQVISSWVFWLGFFFCLFLSFFFVFFFFTVVGAEPGSSALDEISHTRCARDGLGPVRWTSSPD